MVNLERQGFQYLCPTYIKPLTNRSVVLFPSYVFVLLEPHQNWGVLNNTYGVVKLLATRDKRNPRPLFVPNEFIERLQNLTGERDDVPPDTLVRVRHKANPLFDFEGRVKEMQGPDRVVVLMQVFNRDVEVSFERTELEVLSA